MKALILATTFIFLSPIVFSGEEEAEFAAEGICPEMCEEIGVDPKAVLHAKRSLRHYAELGFEECKLPELPQGDCQYCEWNTIAYIHNFVAFGCDVELLGAGITRERYGEGAITSEVITVTLEETYIDPWSAYQNLFQSCREDYQSVVINFMRESANVTGALFSAQKTDHSYHNNKMRLAHEISKINSSSKLVDYHVYDQVSDAGRVVAEVQSIAHIALSQDFGEVCIIRIIFESEDEEMMKSLFTWWTRSGQSDYLHISSYEFYDDGERITILLSPNEAYMRANMDMLDSYDRIEFLLLE